MAGKQAGHRRKETGLLLLLLCPFPLPFPSWRVRLYRLFRDPLPNPRASHLGRWLDLDGLVRLDDLVVAGGSVGV